MVHNVHERLVPAPVEEVGPLLDRLGGPDDVLWPTPAWMPMVLDGRVAVGASGGHGRIRYRVTAHEPGRRVAFTFHPRLGVHGGHTFTAEPAGERGTLLRHVIDARPGGVMRLGWPLAVRWMHDALLEDLLDNAERAAGGEPARAARWSPWVRMLNRLVVADRAQPVPVPATGLHTTALPRVDWADAYAVRARPGTPTDPQVWADAIFRDPPGWVLALLGLRELLVGFVGIERAGPAAFDTVARTEDIGGWQPGAAGRVDEVLLGTDAGHLDFRASVRREHARVVVTTVVRLHGVRGRAYSALVRLVHPAIVRAMLTRAAHNLSRSSNRRDGVRSTIPA